MKYLFAIAFSIIFGISTAQVESYNFLLARAKMLDQDYSSALELLNEAAKELEEYWCLYQMCREKLCRNPEGNKMVPRKNKCELAFWLCFTKCVIKWVSFDLIWQLKGKIKELYIQAYQSMISRLKPPKYYNKLAHVSLSYWKDVLARS